MKSFYVLALLLLTLPLTALAQQTVTYNWDSSPNTVLYVYGNGNATIETDTVHSGTQSLRFEEDPIGGTPQACVAWVRNLVDGDEVTASFWVYDNTPSASPSGRIWGHWNDSADPDSVLRYDGSAGGNSTFSDGTGWEQLEWTWTADSIHTGVIIEARIYASASADANVIWLDDLSITAPGTATFIFPNTGTSLNRNTWGAIKSSF